MGRGHESDLRINDISVSRLHAIIKYKDGRFLLEDNTSKFGTLVLIKKRTPLIPGFNKAVQIGRTVVNFSVKSLASYQNRGQSSNQLADTAQELEGFARIERMESNNQGRSDQDQDAPDEEDEGQDQDEQLYEQLQSQPQQNPYDENDDFDNNGGSGGLQQQ